MSELLASLCGSLIGGTYSLTFNNYIYRAVVRQYLLSLGLCLNRTGSKRIQMHPVRKSDRIGLLPTWDRSETDPKRIQTDPIQDRSFCRSSFGSVWVRSGPPVPERSRVHLDRFLTVPCKQKPFRSGPM